MTRLKTLLTLCVLIAGCQPEYSWADCGHFFRAKVVHHAAVVQQVVAVPYAYYAAGADIQADALAEKVSAKVLKLVQQQLIQQQQVSPHAVQKNVQPAVFAKCVNCHTGPNAAAGLVLDGQTGIDCKTYFRWGQLAGQGKGIPAKMAAVMSGLTPEEKGRINDAFLDLVQPTPAVPPANPQPSGDLE